MKTVEYAKGYDGFTTAIAVLEGQVADGTMTAGVLRRFVIASIVPSHANLGASWESLGGSDAATDWLTSRTATRSR